MNKIKERNYIHYLRDDLNQSQKLTKGARTCKRIILATAEVLKTIKYKDLRVADICSHSGVSTGTFYIYFKGKKEVTIEVLTSFRAMFKEQMRLQVSEDPFDTIQSENMAFLTLASENPGLMSCFLEVGIEVPEVAKFHQKANLEAYSTIVERVLLERPGTNYDLTLSLVVALGSMMDEVTRRLIIEETPFLNEAIDNLDADLEAYCECLSIIWYRTLYGKNPQKVKTKMAKQFLKN